MKKKTYIQIIWLFVIVLPFSLYWSGYILLNHLWKYEFNPDQITKYISEIKGSPSLPDNFSKIHNQLYPYDSFCNIQDYYQDIIWKIFFGGVSKRHKMGNPFSFDVAAIYPNLKSSFNFSIFDPQLILAFKLDQENLNNQLISYYYQKREFILESEKSHCFIKLTGIEELSDYYYGKSIAQLNDNEVLEIILTSYPRERFFFDKNNSTELFNKRLSVLKKQLDRNITEQNN